MCKSLISKRYQSISWRSPKNLVEKLLVNSQNHAIDIKLCVNRLMNILYVIVHALNENHKNLQNLILGIN